MIDAWLGKGPTNLRVKFTEPVPIDRLKAETIFAFLLIDGYLTEDFQFTPYSTISYIKKGENFQIIFLGTQKKINKTTHFKKNASNCYMTYKCAHIF